ncbi:response regulator transcription factor [Paenibacillus thalictri]|uniref:Response regulator n=1 Tax=Paenibacillus thalictri TaxID=2527873 RepID=A0A4Q9DW51_9BACL|nr:response regulator [Paenibacillus thalictri]TBL80616.1 response regulator [Paenibacillus thalictri]
MNKIVIVEDNQITKMGLCENIAWHEHGIEVLAAVDNGEEALELFERQAPDVVISDIVMPLMDGLEMAEHIRISHPDTGIVFLSAHDDFEFARKAIRLGAADYVTKPIDYGYLLDVVKKLLKRRNERRDHGGGGLPGSYMQEQGDGTGITGEWSRGGERPVLAAGSIGYGGGDAADYAAGPAIGPASSVAQIAELPARFEEELPKLIRAGNEAAAVALLGELDAILRASSSHLDYTLSVFFELLCKCIRIVAELGVDREAAFPPRPELFQQLRQAAAENKLQSWLEHMAKRLCAEIAGLGVPNSRQLVQQAVEWVQSSYAREDLGLNLIAREIGLSPSYLSSMFKKEMKQNLSEYIVKLRIEKAQEHLRHTDLKMYEVALKVGFSNPYYFSACFKNHTGMTPNEYKKSASRSS